MSSSHSPTVTGHTLYPLCLRRSVWAVSLVAMLLISVCRSTLTFQRRSPMTLDLWATFWSKVWRLLVSAHMQVSPPMTLTPGILGSQEYIFLQSAQTPQTLPYMLLKPQSRQVTSLLERMISFLRPTSCPTLASTPHQSMRSSSCTGRSMSSFAQYITRFLGEMLLHSCFCRSRQQMCRLSQSGMLLAAMKSRMPCFLPQHSGVISSPPKCTKSSSNVLLMYRITSSTTSHVRSRLGSNCPMQMPLQFTVMPLYFSLLPHDSVCAGESISGITLMPLILAQSITVLRSAGEKVPPTLPDSLSSGTLGTSMGKASQSTMCQWSTFSFEQSIESMALSSTGTGMKCLAVSIISPLHLYEGLSLTQMGSPLTKQDSSQSFSKS